MIRNLFRKFIIITPKKSPINHHPIYPMDQQNTRRFDKYKYHQYEREGSGEDLENGEDMSMSINSRTSYSFGTRKKRTGGSQSMSNGFVEEKSKSLSRGDGVQGNSKISKKRELAIETLQKIKQWRKLNIAPVDTVGCERLHDPNQPIEIQKYQTLIALMLSVQTKDQTTGKIMQRLKNYGLTPKKISQTPPQKLLQLIHETNFNRRKTTNILQTTKKILQNGLPKTKQQLMQFPGIGIKIALLYMRTAQGVNDGIGVDTHVHRITNRLGWVRTKNPKETQEKLQELFPRGMWDGVNICLVGFGQVLCQAKKPKCGMCPVRKVCPSATSSKLIEF